MSKTDASLGSLVGILRFDLPAKSTRTLNATQAYDTSPSQVVLGSFTGKLTDKTATEKSWDEVAWDGSLTASVYGETYRGVGDAAGLKRVINPIAPETVSLSATQTAPIIYTLSSSLGEPRVGGVTFTGMSFGSVGSSSKSKATNANTSYYGAITVGLGEYRKWQGNYAVLKINTVTEKAVLRIYAS